MTRLYYDIIKDIPESLHELDQNLLQITGYDLINIAMRTLQQGLPVDSCLEVGSLLSAGSLGNHFTAAVVPMTMGKGIIPGFAEAVTAILKHLGIRAWITEYSDVGGLGEAFREGADLIFAADDDKFHAFNLNTLQVVDNSWATAKVFIQSLTDAITKDQVNLSEHPVLVLGLGPVGIQSVNELRNRQVEVWIYDVDEEKTARLAENDQNLRVVRDPVAAMQQIRYLVDATPAADIINEEMISPSTIISCPGVPHGLTRAARSKIGSRLIYDNLALGVATMAVYLLKKDS